MIKIYRSAREWNGNVIRTVNVFIIHVFNVHFKCYVFENNNRNIEYIF